MKRFLFTLTMIFALALTGQAAPVSFSLAKTAASKFIEERFAVESRSGLPELVYTGPNNAFYVFNFAEKGFVIIAGEDAYRPVIGYSTASAFDVNDIPPALSDYLDGIAENIFRLGRQGSAVADPLVAAEWESVLSHGRLISRNGGRGVDYLCQTQWNQTYPYNYCCPDDPDGSGGHAIVGCLATAMSQLMRFWASPTQGVGSHCYVHEDYGEICADFGNTVYDWSNMPNVLDNNATEEEKLATGTLCFHCGVTIDMGYGPDGSGGASGPIPSAMHTYFNYSDQIQFLKRDNYDTETWKAMVREQFDMGWPMYYGGCQDGGCHAFVCDGYDDYDMFHFNLGWGGGSDGWYLIDEAPYTHPADAMFNFVPAEVYDQTPSAPSDFTAVPASDTELRTLLSWTNPSTTLNGTPLSSIDTVVVLRDNEIIRTFTDVTPGSSMEIEDVEVPRFDVYHYAVYVFANDRHGRHANAQQVAVGPSCAWKIIMTSTDIHGWNGGCLKVYNAAGHEVSQCTLNNTTPTLHQPSLPLGKLYFSWVATTDTVETMGFVIRDSEDHEVYSFLGSSAELASGIFFETNNSCGADFDCEVPGNLVATADGDPILLTWDAVEHEGYGYLIYRDGLLCRLIPSGTSFHDDEASMGGHCYQVTVLCEGGESGAYSNVSCATSGPCYPPRDLDYELTSNFKIKLNWEAPLLTEGLSGYKLYRKKGNGEYVRIKQMNASTQTYTDATANEEGDYYYQLYAYYKDLDCTSSPANRKYETNVFELHAYYSPTGVEESSSWTIAPNPTNGIVTISGVSLQQVEVYTMTGQLVVEKPMENESLTLDLKSLPSGLYFLNLIHHDGSSCVRKLIKQ